LLKRSNNKYYSTLCLTMKEKKYSIYSLLVVTIAISAVFMAVNCTHKEEIPKLSGEIDYNLLLISVDSLRADRLGCYGFSGAETPAIDNLAGKGVLFKHCYSPVPVTLPVYSSIFTGRTPLSHGVRNNSTYFLPDEELTLAEILSDQNFFTYAVVSSPHLMGKFGINQGFSFFNDSLDYKGGGGLDRNYIKAASVYTKFNSWFERSREEDERFFAWVHFSDPQTPFDLEEKFKNRFAKDPYSGEIAAVDFYIGKIIDELAARKLLEKTLIVIAGGYGEAFGEHGEYGHGIFCYNESLEVPLIFSNPRLFKKGVQVSHRVSLLDIMPTILQLFSIENPAAAEGGSIASFFVEKEEDKPDSPSPFYFESMVGEEEMNLAPLTGLIYDQYKYIALPDEELYDVDRDPLEKENIIIQDRQLTDRIKQRYRDYIRTYRNEALPSNARQTSSANGQEKNLLDPKQGIPLINRLAGVKKLIADNNLAEAEKKLDQIREEYRDLSSDNPYIYENRHELLLKKGDIKGCEKILERGIALFPAVRQLRIKLASFYLESDQIVRAKKVCREILSKNPGDNEARILLRRVLKKDGGIDDQTLEFYKKTLELEPLNAEARVEFATLLQAMGKNDEVLEIVSRLMEDDNLMNDTASLDIKTGIGMLLLRMGQFDRTITLCLHMVSQGHKNSQILNQLGKAYSGKSDFDNALDAYNKALELDEKNALTLSNLGTLHLTLLRVKRDAKFLSQALEYYSRSLEVDPQMLPALNGLAVAYNFAGEPEKSVKYWRKALEINPNFSDVYFNLGLTYLKLGMKKEALKYFQLLKDRLYNRLSPREQEQVDSLIKEASQ